MKKIFVANWKENPRTEREAAQLFAATRAAARRAARVTVVVCPPFIYLEKIARDGQAKIAVGAQDVSWMEKGAHTGEVGPKMLKRLGVRYVIVGHSERRATGETDATINKKIKSALRDGLRVILCIGESASVRRMGIAAAKQFVKSQLQKDLKSISAPRPSPLAPRLLIAYEPIWAIGTGTNDTLDDARTMAVFIKKIASPLLAPRPSPLAPRILYGGSVNSKNIGDYVQCKEIDGALVGGASLKKDEIKKMIMKISNS
jgi:triosephosphate isomerase (TIM)